MAMSGTNRMDPGRPLWNDGLAKVRLVPPPAPNWNPRFAGGTSGGLPNAMVSESSVRLVLQPVWKFIVLSGFSARLVPPTDVANGELLGKPTVLNPTEAAKSPESPEEKFTSIPWAAADSRMRLSRIN